MGINSLFTLMQGKNPDLDLENSQRFSEPSCVSGVWSAYEFCCICLFSWGNPEDIAIIVGSMFEKESKTITGYAIS